MFLVWDYTNLNEGCFGFGVLFLKLVNYGVKNKNCYYLFKLWYFNTSKYRQHQWNYRKNLCLSMLQTTNIYLYSFLAMVFIRKCDASGNVIELKSILSGVSYGVDA